MKKETFLEYIIKIGKVREKTKIDVGTWEYKDKMYLVNIKESGVGIAFSVKATGNCGRDLRRVFRAITKSLYLTK